MSVTCENVMFLCSRLGFRIWQQCSYPGCYTTGRWTLISNLNRPHYCFLTLSRQTVCTPICSTQHILIVWTRTVQVFAMLVGTECGGGTLTYVGNQMSLSIDCLIRTKTISMLVKITTTILCNNYGTEAYCRLNSRVV